MDSLEPRLRIARGLLAAGSFGIIVAVVVAGLLVLKCWLAPEVFDRSLQDELRWFFQRKGIYPVIGCAAVCACAAWATYAPRGTFRFAGSLAIVCGTTIPLWYFLTSLHPRRKGDDFGVDNPSDLAILIVPPILVAVVLTVVRMYQAPKERSTTASDKEDAAAQADSETER